MAAARATIRDVARVASVSRQTVSRVINGENHISPETRERVLLAVQELGFVPSQIARSLVTRRTHLVGLLMGDVGNPYFADIARGAESALAPAGWSLVLANTEYNQEKELTILNHLVQKSVDGFVMCDTNTPVEELAEMAQRVDIPMVLLNRTSSGIAAPNLGVVRTDRSRAAVEAVSRLVEMGHRRIGLMISGRATLPPRSRLEGYMDALARSAIPFDESLVVREMLNMDGGRLAGLQLLSLEEPPSAVLCQGDLMAFGLMRACAERGVKIPGDLSVIGWDDLPFDSVVAPPLSSIHVPRFDLGLHAGEMLLKMINHEPTEMDVELPSPLILRESCAPYAAPRGSGTT
jgi:LacI family transcriptional regulator